MEDLEQPRSLAKYVTPDVDDARLDRQWAAIDAAGLPSAHKRGVGLVRVIVPTVAALAAAALVFTFTREDAHVDTSAALPSGARVQSGAEGFDVQLRDGSTVALGARTELRIDSNAPAAVAMELERGRARFAVTKRAARSFSVRAGELEVRVVGTRFSVSRDFGQGRDRVGVSVEEGRVEVRRRGQGEVRYLGAGERLSVELAEPVPRAAAAALPEQESDAVEEEPAPSAATTTVARRPRERAPSPADIFERANVARRAGRVREAAEAYDALLTRHRGDARAGIAAFELGRIRMEALGDPRGAIAAFSEALELSPSAAAREDAMARIAIAYDALGDQEACRRARERYLSRYPSGVHRADLASRCGGS